jgi:hypothetical protein
MLYRDIIAVFSQVHTKHINTLRGMDVEFLNIKPGGRYNYHYAFKGLRAVTRLLVARLYNGS